MASAVPVTDVSRYVLRADRNLRAMEDAQYRDIRDYLVKALAKLVRAMNKHYPVALSEAEAKAQAYAIARARMLAKQLETQIQAFDLRAAGFSNEYIAKALQRSSLAGVRESAALLDMFEPGLGAQLLETGVSIPFTALLAESKDGAARLYRYSQEYIALAKDSVIQSMIQGEGVQKATRRLRVLTGQLSWKAERVVRTEMLHAHDTAQRKSYADADIDHVQRVGTMDDRICEYCAARVGNVYEVGDAPAALHPNDRCFPSGTVVSGPAVLASTTRQYVGQVVIIETASGIELTTTPNHPILTDQGWVGAGSLHEGSNVFRALDAEGIGAAISPDNHQPPALIEEVSATVGEAFGGASRAVPVSPEQFHGDGVGSEVCVIRSDSPLRNRIEAKDFQPILHHLLSGPSAHLAFLTGSGALLQRPFGSNRSSEGIPSSIGSFGSLGLGHIGPGDSALFGPGSRGDPEFFQSNVDSVPLLTQTIRYSLDTLARLVASLNHGPAGLQSLALSFDLAFSSDTVRLSPGPLQPVNLQVGSKPIGVHAESPSRVLHAIASRVALDRVIKVSFASFSGHVHNLETEAGFYIAENVVVGNCYNIPWKQSWQDAGLTDDTWMKAQRKESVGRLKDQGQKPRYGKAPFEKMNDLSQPKPVWTPTAGYTVHGKRSLKKT